MAEPSARKDEGTETTRENDVEVALLRTVDVHFGPSVQVDGLKAQAIRAIVVAAAEFTKWGFDCWVTSAVRPSDTDSLHCYGMAVDFDSSDDMRFDVFKALEEDIQSVLGDNYDVIYHKGHIHVEFDSTGHDIDLYRNQNT